MLALVGSERQKAELEAKKKAELAAKQRAEHEAKIRAQQQKAELKAKKMAELVVKQRAEHEAKMKAQQQKAGLKAMEAKLIVKQRSEHEARIRARRDSERAAELASIPIEILVEQERERYQRECSYVKRKTDLAVSRIIDELTSDRGSQALDSEALEMFARRMNIMRKSVAAKYNTREELNNALLKALFEHYDISHSKTIDSSDFKGLMTEAMCVNVDEAELQLIFAKKNLVKLQVVQEWFRWYNEKNPKSFVKYRARQQEKLSKISQPYNVSMVTEEDRRLAQAKILLKLKNATSTESRKSFRRSKPVRLPKAKMDAMLGSGWSNVFDGNAGADVSDSDSAVASATITMATVQHRGWLAVSQNTKTAAKGKNNSKGRPMFAYLQGTRLYTAYVGKIKRSIVLKEWRPEVKGYIGTFATEDNHRFFTVQLGGNKNLFLMADTVNEKQTWMNAINDSIPQEVGLSSTGSFRSPKTPKGGETPLWHKQGVVMQGILSKLPMTTSVVQANKAKKGQVMKAAEESGNVNETMKAPKLLQKSGWERRFFQLRDGVLSYYALTEVTMANDGSEEIHKDDEGGNQSKGVEVSRCKILMNDVQSMWAHLESRKKTKKKKSQPDLKELFHLRFSISRPPLNLTCGCSERAEYEKWVDVLTKTSCMVEAKEHGLEQTQSQRYQTDSKKVLYRGWLMKKGKGKYDAFKARYFVYNAAGEVKYYKTNKTQGDGTLGKPLGTIETADAREVRWSMDSVLKPSQYPSPHCLEVVMRDRTWKLCPFHCAENTGSGGNYGQLLEDAKKDLARFKRIIEESHQTHKLAHSTIATSDNARGKDRQLIAGKSTDISFVRGTGMTAYERKTGNVPPSYLSYSKFSEQIANSGESLELMSPRTDIVHGMSVQQITPRSRENELERIPPTPSPIPPTPSPIPPTPSPRAPAAAAAASAYAEGDEYYDDMEAAAF